MKVFLTSDLKIDLLFQIPDLSQNYDPLSKVKSDFLFQSTYFLCHNPDLLFHYPDLLSQSTDLLSHNPDLLSHKLNLLFK